MIQNNKDITDFSNFRTFAKAKFFYEFTWNLGELRKVLQFKKENNLNLLVLWGWTNLLFAFDVFDGLVIKVSIDGFEYNKNNKILKSFAWEKIRDLAVELEERYQNNIWHRFIWLPWTIWWAVFWNAWCFGLETENNFLECETFNLETERLEVFKKEDMDFSYRSSILKKTGNYILISCKFDLSKNVEKYHSDIDNIYFREHKQPKGQTCWSFFKNPSRENSAGKLIEEVWLKGFYYKGAFFSNKHANFLMGDKNVKYHDLIELIWIAKKKVKENYWIELQEEVRIIKNL